MPNCRNDSVGQFFGKERLTGSFLKQPPAKYCVPTALSFSAALNITFDNRRNDEASGLLAKMRKQNHESTVLLASSALKRNVAIELRGATVHRFMIREIRL